MLTHIHIKHFAIIDELELDLNTGLTVLTGETGAGKSIIVDAVQLALGERAESGVIRAGSDKCEITLNFDVKQLKEARKWLEDNELASDDECIIHRSIRTDGRSRSTINGQSVPLAQLRELGLFLVNLHGQHQQQALLKRDAQREAVDIFAEAETLAAQVYSFYQKWRQINEHLTQLSQQSSERETQLEFLRFQVEEFNKLALTQNELTELNQEHKQLASADALIAACSQSLNLLTEADDHPALSTVYKSIQQLEHFKDMDPKFAATIELLNNAAIQIEEASNEIQYFLDKFELNPERLQQIEQRLAKIHDLARKHKVKPEELAALQQQLQTKLQQLDNSDVQLDKLQQQLKQLATDYFTSAKKLSAARQKAVAILNTKITILIQQLGMPQGQFVIALNALKSDYPLPHGLEDLEFMITTNPGQPLQPLNKVASGGELSRISLALYVTLAQTQATPTLIFDEVDVGISGGIAEIVGQLLRNLAKAAQIFCITHLPQVAAQGHQHLQVSKQVVKNSTQTTIKALTVEEKINEIARMLGGVKLTKTTLDHAKEMLELANT